MARASAKPKKKVAAPKKKAGRKPSTGPGHLPEPALDMHNVVAALLGPELVERLHTISLRRDVFFDDLLREAVQKYLEAEFVEPTTPAKDEALYPPTDKPLEEAPVIRSSEPSDEQVHERTTLLGGEVPPGNGTAH